MSRVLSIVASKFNSVTYGTELEILTHFCYNSQGVWFGQSLHHGMELNIIILFAYFLPESCRLILLKQW